MFRDTLTAGTTSKRGKKYAEVFATNFGLTRTFPMKSKSESHEDFQLMFQRDGLTPQMIVDGSKEQVGGDFARKCKEAGCYLKQTEPCSPCHNSAEGGIKELKRGVGHKMLKARPPKRLWDGFVKLELYLRSHAAQNIY